jgi:uncharacterized protein (DUF433 family)
LDHSTVFKGIVHGNTIKLEGELGIPDGQEVTVIVQTPRPAECPPKRLPPGEGIRRSSGAWAEGGAIDPPPTQGTPEDLPRAELWADRLVFDPAVLPGERIVKGTNLAAEALVAEIEQSRNDAEILRAHPELTPEDVRALRAYARVPAGFRLSFGAWAEDGDDLDRYIKSVYERRRVQQRRPIESFDP